MKESLRLLLTNLVDYAGLFPPAELTMPEAVRNYADYQDGEHSWMLGRFIVPLARIDEFTDALANNSTNNPSHKEWRLSALGTGDLRPDLARIARFQSGEGASATKISCVVDALEIKTPGLTELGEVARFKQLTRAVRPRDDADFAELSLQSVVEIFCEIPINEKSEEIIAAVADAKSSAKVRTGGVTEDAFPSIDQLARFIHLCARRGAAFKATAGLHHPLRASQRLTYEADSATTMMHGFLNVFIASAFARAGAPQETLEEILEAQDSSDFRFTDEGIKWRDISLDIDQIKNGRGDFALSFGSCSFTEPLDDLKELNLL